ncbi:MAG: host specificity factor TipJ family phage tail protein [Pseudomonadota bacterium]|nr:host specificity factor TipJ family phage tail protein [Pseudomonadota bacterium]
MAQIYIQRDPSAINKVERYKITHQVNLAEWIEQNEEINFGGLHAQIILNGKSILKTWEGEPEQHDKAIDIELGAFDTVNIVLRPAGLDPFTIGIVIAAVVVTAAISIALAPKPVIPTTLTDGGEGRASNNQLNAAKNAYRPRQAIPDIAGQVVSYPDFAQLSYYEYQNNKRIFREIFCIGVGQYTVADVKIGDDDLLGITGDNYTIYHDASPPNLLNVRPNRNSQEVDITPPDQATDTVNFDNVGFAIASSNTLVLNESIMQDLDLQIGDSVDISVTYRTGAEIYETLNVLGTVLTVDSDRFSISEDVINENGGPLAGYITKLTGTNSDKWYVLEGDAITEVWLDLKMPSGIKSNTGGSATVTLTLTIEELDASGTPTGVTYERGCVFAGNTRTAQFQTFKLTQDDGIGIGRFRAKIDRITNSLGDNAIDLVTMEAVKSITPYTADFGDVTLLDVQRSSNARVSRGQSDKLNCLVTRKLRIYDHTTNTYGATYEETRRFCDYAFYLLHEVSGVAVEDIDESLWDIYDNLSDDQLGYFDGTFDDKNMSLRDRMEIICNTARVRYWNVGIKWFFVREEAKLISSMMFNRRNLSASRSHRFTQSFRRPSDYDGVTIRYVDPETNSEAQIYRSIDATGAIVNEEGLNSLEFNMTVGCRNVLQAINRAELEVRRLIYQSAKVTDTALMDALEMQIGERVDYVDIFDGDTFDGEILALNGNTYTTSERFDPVGGVTYYVYVTDDNGNISNSVVATPRSDGNIYGFEAIGLSGVYLAGGTIQSGSRYVIASAEDLEAQSYIAIARGKPNEQGECSIELAEYNELMFEAD